MRKWYDEKGAFGDIAISTRIRLARNLTGFPFPGNMTREQESELLAKVSGVLSFAKEPYNFKLNDLTKLQPAEALSLFERHLISSELASGSNIRGVMLSEDDSLSVMIGEEDHIRLQVLGPGFCLKECLDAAFRLDDLLDESLSYAFDEELGYLTRCPTNVGTGMRASLMLHLPALTETGAIKAVVSAAAKLGVAIRGLFGEGSSSSGALYQISNQLTLGLSEQDIVSRLIDIVTEIIEKEKGLRNRSYDANRVFIEDRVWRAAGTLASARLLSTAEAMALLSDLRLGLSLKILDGIKFESLNRMIGEIQPNTLSLTAAADGANKSRDACRADFVRREVSAVFDV